MSMSSKESLRRRVTKGRMARMTTCGLLAGAAVLGIVGQGMQAGAEQQSTAGTTASQTLSASSATERLSDFDAAGENQFLSWINIMRAQVGAPPVALDPFLVNYARGQAQLMAAQGGLSHTDITNRLAGWFAGENVGMGGTTNQVHDAFVASPSHYAIMITPRYSYVGVGVYRDGAGRVWVSEDYVGH
jgi:uncharacterized protein YkwD